MVSRTKGYEMPHLCPWPLDAIEYDGCCSRTCLREPIFGAIKNLTPKQIEALDAERQFVDAERKLKNSRRDAKTRGKERIAQSSKKKREKPWL